MSGNPKRYRYDSLEKLAQRLRDDCGSGGHDFIVLYAYNGTGKTRLSMEFKEAAKQRTGVRDTLYFNAFTEDLFTWDNDLEYNSTRVLRLNTSSQFFAGLTDLEMESRIRPFLHRYVDFDFRIDYERGTVSFSRTIIKTSKHGSPPTNEIVDSIKVSRGEENIFIWCFFLAIVQAVLDGAESYQWVKYLFIDDPISSLDDNNAIAVGTNLVQLLKKSSTKLKTIISSHHSLFFNVVCNVLDKGKGKRYFLSKDPLGTGYILESTGDTPFFHHVAALVELHKAAQHGTLYTYHFTILRSILEKTASFHGLKHFTDCLTQDDDDSDGILYARIINILSHGNYSLYDPQEMLPENKAYFVKILTDFRNRYPFNPALFSADSEETTTS